MAYLVKAKPTTLDGVKFRSRLEARWSLFFNRLKIPWDFEPERFRWDEHVYTPDLHLLDYDGWYVEVKGPKMPLDYKKKLTSAVASKNTPINGLILCGEIPSRFQKRRLPMHQVIINDGPSAVKVGWVKFKMYDFIIQPFPRRVLLSDVQDGTFDWSFRHSRVIFPGWSLKRAYSKANNTNFKD